MKDKATIRVKMDAVLDERDEDYENPTLQARDETLGFLLGEADSPVSSIVNPPTSDEDLDHLVKEVKAEYSDLPRYSMFGDPNWKIRDATIEILEWAKG